MEISKLKRDGKTIFPATITDAIVHKEVKATLTSFIKSYNVTKLFPKEDGTYYNLKESIDTLNPVLLDDQKIKGTIISFIDSNNIIREYEFIGDDFSNVLSWVEIGGDKINELSNKLIELDEKINPLVITLEGSGVFKKGTSQDITLRWSIKKNNVEITPDNLYINDSEIINTSKSRIFRGVTNDTTYTLKVVISEKIYTKSVNVLFVNPKYFGIVDPDFSPTSENISLLSEIITNSRYHDSTSTLNFQKLCYSYPSKLGKLTKIMDDKNVNYLEGSYTLTEETINDENYYSYVLTNPTTIINFKQTYS